MSANQLLKLASGAVWLVIAVILAQLTWWLVSPSEEVAATPPPASSFSLNNQRQQGVNVEPIQQLDLFGQAQQSNQSQRRNAPQTSLNIRLVGVSASSNPERSAAIIEQGGKQQTYIVDDSIGGSNVTLEEIYADRVILNNNGRLETLQLEDIGEDRPALSLQVQPATVDVTASEVEADQSMADAISEVRNNPAKLTELVSIQPAVQQGELQGYRLTAGNNPRLFNQAGLKNGDLAVAINGYDLTNMQQATQLMGELANMTRANITVVRSGQRVELELELPQSQGN